MKHLDDPAFTKYRINVEWIRQQIGAYYDRFNAAMVIVCDASETGTVLRVIAASGKGWDHVSVSVHDRTPTWYEMEHVRKLLFHPHEVVVQYHVPDTDHVNIHPNCLHLWRPIHKKLPMPPKELV